MSSDRWIIIPRWDEFQHRDMARSSQPPWIKNYTRLLDDDDYLGLSGSQRAILHGLWLLYASHRRVLSESIAKTKLCQSAGEAKYWRRNIEALNHAGFVAFSASRPARNYASNPASLEVEKEVEIEGFTKSQGRARANGTPHTHRIERLITNGALADPLDLEAELAAETTLTDQQRDFLRQLIPAGHDHIPLEHLTDTEPETE